ncbi:hypothetical protein PSHT_12867, partial [Puccinia striiformis]
MTFTPNSELDLLFDPKWLEENPQLDSDLHIRPLSKTDYQRDHLKLLAGLTSAPDTGLADYQARFELLRNVNKATPDRPSYCLICIVRKSDDKLVASGTLLLEHKFLRACGSVGHIEDIVVDPEVRGKNLGKQIITALTQTSERLGAYKTILDCNKDNIPFYEKCGFQHKEYEMVRYTPEETVARYKNNSRSIDSRLACDLIAVTKRSSIVVVCSQIPSTHEIYLSIYMSMFARTARFERVFGGILGILVFCPSSKSDF